MFHLTYLEPEPKPLNKREKRDLWILAYIVIPALCYMTSYAQSESARWEKLEQRNSQPVALALPAELPASAASSQSKSADQDHDSLVTNIWEFGDASK